MIILRKMRYMIYVRRKKLFLRKLFLRLTAKFMLISFMYSSTRYYAEQGFQKSQRKFQFSFFHLSKFIKTYTCVNICIYIYICVIIENYIAFFHEPLLEIFQLLGETSGQVHFLT